MTTTAREINGVFFFLFRLKQKQLTSKIKLSLKKGSKKGSKKRIRNCFVAGMGCGLTAVVGGNGRSGVPGCCPPVVTRCDFGRGVDAFFLIYLD